jgi:hypothetical protein
MKSWIGVAAVVVLVLLSGVAHASFPCGIYARVDKVELGPDPGKPTWVKVWGDFLLVKTSGRLCETQRGYMYFEIVKAKEEHCRIEWKDLEEIAKTTKYVAFGSAYSERNDALGRDGENPNVHKKDTKDPKPIPYPLNTGLSRLRSKEEISESSPVGILQKYLASHPLEKP